MRMKLTALALAALLPLSAVQAVENVKQPMPASQQQERKATSGKRLSKEQRQKMQDMRETHREAQRNLYLQTWEKLPQKERDAYEAKRSEMRDKHQAEMRSLLTPEQQQAMDKRMQKMQKKFEKRGGMHGRDKRGMMHYGHPGDCNFMGNCKFSRDQ